MMKHLPLRRTLYVLTSEVLEDSVDGRFSMYNSVRIRYLSAPGIDLETEFEVF